MSITKPKGTRGRTIAHLLTVALLAGASALSAAPAASAAAPKAQPAPKTSTAAKTRAGAADGAPALGVLAQAPGVTDAPVVCIVDSGVRDAPGVGGHVVSRSVLTSDPALSDPAIDHGTEVARAVLQTWPSARIASVRVVENQAVDPRLYAPGIDACVAAGADVVNLSLAGPVFDDAQVTGTLRAAATRARDAGVDVVVAAGNDAGPLEYPAAVLTDLGVVVDATNGTATRCSFASTGNGVTVGASGCPLSLPTDDGTYAPVSGSSVSAPQVAATLAALHAYAPGLDVAGRRATISNLPGMTLDQAEVLRRAGRADLLPKAAARPRVAVAWSRGRARLTVVGAPAKLRVTVRGNGRKLVSHRKAVTVPARLLRRRGVLTVIVATSAGDRLSSQRLSVPVRVTR